MTERKLKRDDSPVCPWVLWVVFSADGDCQSADAFDDRDAAERHADSLGPTVYAVVQRLVPGTTLSDLWESGDEDDR